MNRVSIRPFPVGGVEPMTELDIAAVEKGLCGTTVSVVLPALNEADTVAGVIDSLSGYRGNLASEIVVMDSGSTDDTAVIAADHGATVVSRTDVLPQFAPLPGKGEVLWRSLAATSGDIVVFIDADLRQPDPFYLPRLLQPFIGDPEVQLVKGYYRRPEIHEDNENSGGGRVTELVARPLLSALAPELRGIIQPLGGEYAGKRELLESLPFPPGYGVEIGLLFDTYKRLGIGAIAQADLGIRRHRHRDLQSLGVMSRQIVATIFARLGIEDSGDPLQQFVDLDGRLTEVSNPLDAADRPPITSIR